MGKFAKHPTVFLLIFLITNNVYTQSTISEHEAENIWNNAIPFITAYSPDDYKGMSQNWGFAQADNGIIYVANSTGVLEFDGVFWRVIQTSNAGSVRSLIRSTDGTIYVGGSREIGYLKPDKKGRLQYESLLPKLNTKFYDFTDVWSTYEINGAIYFSSFQYLFKWHNGKFTVFLPSKSFVKDVVFNGELLLNDSGKGLKILQNDSLVSAGYNPNIPSNPLMLPLDKDKIFVFDIKDGAYVYDFKSYQPFMVNGEQFLKGINTYAGVKLANGNFLITTSGDGVYIFDENGKIKSHLTMKNGLVSDTVYAAFIDNSGNVWLGTSNGINRVEIASNIRRFGNSSGLTDGVVSTVFHQNKLFAACFNGLFVSNMDSIDYAFTKVPNTNEIAGLISLLSEGRDLWVGAMGIYQFRDEELQKHYVPEGQKASNYAIIQSRFNPNMNYVVNAQGQLYKFFQTDKGWEFSKPLIELNARIHHLIEDNSGSIWLATYLNGIQKVEVIKSQNNLPREVTVVQYDSLKGLPGLKQNSLCFANEAIYSGTQKGLFRYHQSSDLFKRDTVLDKYFPTKDYSCGLLSVGFDESLWIPTFSNFENMEARLFKITKEGNAEEIVAARRNDDKQIFTINADQKAFTLVTGTKGIAVYKTDEETKNSPLHLNLRKVTALNDSLLFGGYYQSVSNNSEINYNARDLRFEYALAEFDEPLRNQYQYYLQGYDKDWSNWSKETQKDYTNLPEGNYTFKVHAKNIYGQISEEDTYSFAIRPPWYRTWWAYSCYILFGVLMLWAFGRWRSQQLRNKNLALEALVDERTEEVRQKNKLLTYQSERLKEMDTMKTRLFANISHEFRTPLTLIKGPIEKLEEARETNISIPNIKMIRRNANRLLNLVNQLLDLSKLDSGKLKLNEAEGDVFKCVRAAASAFSSHAASRQMDYQIKIPSRLLWASFDRDKLEKIVYNLLSNAFKFTDDEARVIIEAEFRSGRLKLKVSDRGSGIAADKLPHIFDRFFQVDDSYTKEKSGSGIGLTLTKELTELMGGTTYVESELGKGTSFRVVIPLEEIESGEIHKVVEQDLITAFEDESEGGAMVTTDGKEANILIIEDNNDMRHFIREQLESDYGVMEARNGKEGLKMALKIIPDLIITDLMMPQMDGITLCKKLKTDINTSHIPVIMLTAKAGIENKLEGLETGADDYLTKPFNAKELQIRTKNLIEQRQLLRERFSKNISLDPKEITVTSLDEGFLKQILALLEEKHVDPEFGVPQMQTELGMSKTVLHTKIKALTNHPPGELLRNFRLKRAAQLLSQSGENISQTAYDVGFNSLSYFTRCFKELYGMSPSEYIHKNL